MLLSFAAWLTPLHAASALKQNNAEEIIFINYEQFRKKEPYGPLLHPATPKKLNAKPRITVSSNKSSSSRYSGWHYSKEEVQTLIIQYSQQYGINPEVPLCIARYESGYNYLSSNKSSSASGVFQYLSGT